HFSHALHGGCVRGTALTEESDDVLLAPMLYAAVLAAPYVGREPVFQRAAAQIFLLGIAAHEVLSRVTGATMGRSIDEVAATVPLLGALGIGLELPLFEI